MNLVDRFPDSDFLAAYHRTIKKSFKSVYLLTNNPIGASSTRTTFVVLSSNQPINFGVLETLVMNRFNRAPNYYLFPNGRVDALLVLDEFLLTDDYVPVDNLLAPLVTSRRVA